MMDAKDQTEKEWKREGRGERMIDRLDQELTSRILSNFVVRSIYSLVQTKSLGL